MELSFLRPHQRHSTSHFQGEPWLFILWYIPKGWVLPFPFQVPGLRKDCSWASSTSDLKCQRGSDFKRTSYVAPCFMMCMGIWCAQSCMSKSLRLMECSLPGSSIHGTFQTRILGWLAISCFRGSSQPRDWTWISYISCISRQILYLHDTALVTYEAKLAVRT